MGRTLRTILRHWRLFAWMDLVWITRQPGFFLTYFVSDMLLALGTIATTFLLAARFEGIGPWSEPRVVFMLGYALLVRAVQDMFFGFNVAIISRRIGRGQLDHVLIQPHPVWLTLLTEGFIPFSGAMALVPGIALVLWAARQLALHPTALWLGLAVINLLASCAITLAFSFLWGSVAYWAPRAAEEISSAAMSIMREISPFPLDGLGPVWLGGLLTVLPTGFVAWYPCRALLGIDPAPYAPAVTPLAAVLLSGLAVIVFYRGLMHYGRVGSQRYLSFGHRR
ncbi:MAG: ABC-2 family transporter protein [Chloroflexi bacterium]|nr:ABC-2 family transporter protein [Chloroflexota bacterium]